jgi:hypothetical protein
MCKTWGRIRIGIGIKMERGIRIGINTMPIHYTDIFGHKHLLPTVLLLQVVKLKRHMLLHTGEVGMMTGFIKPLFFPRHHFVLTFVFSFTASVSL